MASKYEENTGLVVLPEIIFQAIPNASARGAGPVDGAAGRSESADIQIIIPTAIEPEPKKAPPRDKDSSGPSL